MKRKFMQGLVLTLLSLFTLSCQKESGILFSEIDEGLTSTADLRGSCRLTSYDYYDGITNTHSITYFTYENGLLDNVFATDGLRYNLEYGEKKTLTTARAYDAEETLIYVITFIYEKNRIVREVWLNATTNTIEDEIFLTYDKKGNIIRTESFIQDYYVDNTYTANGSLTSWQLFASGSPVVKGEYTYNSNYKNPYNSIKGVDYSFWSRNSAFGIKAGNTWYSSEKVTVYIEGEPVIYYEQDPAKTVWQVGQQHYSLQANYALKGSNDLIINTFGYENCNPNVTGQKEKNTASGQVKFSNRDKKNLKYPYPNAIEKVRGL
jgi:uncharacterized protein YuzE